MKQIQLAKNKESFEGLDHWHDRFESELRCETETRRVETSFGFTDVVITGDPATAPADDEPPVVVLHGAMAGAPFALGELCDLPAKRRMIAVNIPGQSTRAAQVRLDFRTDEYSQWFGEIMDRLAIKRPVICGVSWGGSVALQVAQYSPQHIGGLILAVPGSIVRGPTWKGFWQMGWPIMRYKFFPTERNLERALENLCTSSGELWTPYLGDALRQWNVDFSIPPLAQVNDLNLLTAPVYVIAADQDISFPGVPLIDRSQQLFPNLVGHHLLKNSKHCPSFTNAGRRHFTDVFEQALIQVSEFLNQNGRTSEPSAAELELERNSIGNSTRSKYNQELASRKLL